MGRVIRKLRCKVFGLHREDPWWSDKLSETGAKVCSDCCRIFTVGWM